jgi:hypothetical protein
VNLVLSDDGKPKFQIEEVEPSKKGRYLTKKHLKVPRKREKKKRKEANKNNPRRIRPKGRKIKQKFPTAEARLKYKIEKVVYHPFRHLYQADTLVNFFFESKYSKGDPAAVFY